MVLMILKLSRIHNQHIKKKKNPNGSSHRQVMRLPTKTAFHFHYIDIIIFRYRKEIKIVSKITTQRSFQ